MTSSGRKMRASSISFNVSPEAHPPKGDGCAEPAPNQPRARRSAASARSGVVSSKGSRTARAAPMAGRSRIQSWCLCCPSRICRCTPSGYSRMIVSPGQASGWNSNVAGAVSNSAGPRIIVVTRTSGDQNTAWRSAGHCCPRSPACEGCPLQIRCNHAVNTTFARELVSGKRNGGHGHVKGIFDAKPNSGYDDEVTRRYHSPPQYRAVAERLVGDWIIYASRNGTRDAALM